MEPFTIICLCALGLAAIIAGGALKRRAARLRLRAISTAQPARLRESAAPVQQHQEQPRGTNDCLRAAWSKCGDARRALDQAPDCEAAKADFQRAVFCLAALSEQLKDQNCARSIIVDTARQAVQNADAAITRVRQFQRQATQR